MVAMHLDWRDRSISKGTMMPSDSIRLEQNTRPTSRSTCQSRFLLRIFNMQELAWQDEGR